MGSESVYVATAETASTPTKGRAVTRVRDRNFLVDDPATLQYDDGPGEELGAAELFLAGITTCATLMIHRIARAKELPVEHVSVRMEGHRDMEAPRERGPQALDKARMHFVYRGVTQEQAAYLTDAFQNMCPLYGSVAIATPDTEVTFEVAR